MLARKHQFHRSAWWPIYDAIERAGYDVVMSLGVDGSTISATPADYRPWDGSPSGRQIYSVAIERGSNRDGDVQRAMEELAGMMGMEIAK